jgi:cytochrome c oxidase subunit 4
MSHSEAELKNQVKIYISVFVVLMFLTLVTVAVSYLHLSTLAAIAVALIIASIKAGLVAAYFMHLISERTIIYAVLGLTALFFLVLLLSPVYSV